MNDALIIHHPPAGLRVSISPPLSYTIVRKALKRAARRLLLLLCDWRYQIVAGEGGCFFHNNPYLGRARKNIHRGAGRGTMESYGWRGQGSSNQPETGIAQALDYYARYGGELLGARRSDNPLTLTHVRWHDQSGHVYDATHSPEMSGEIDSAEREVWVQLALDLPVAAAGMYGARAPWERLALDQGRAAELLTHLRRSLASRTSGNSNNPAQWASGAPSPMMQRPPIQPQPYPPQRSVGNPGWGAGQSPESNSAFPPPSLFQAQPQHQQPPSSLRGAPLPSAGMPGG